MNDIFLEDEKGGGWGALGNSGIMLVPPNISCAYGCITYPLPARSNIPLTVEDFLKRGWQIRYTKDVFKGFLRLVNGGEKAVLTFVQNYGPLWICDHSFLPGAYQLGPFPEMREPLCLWRPSITGGGTIKNYYTIEPQRHSECVWQGREPVWLFLKEAQKIYVLHEAAASLKYGDPIPKECWQILGYTPWEVRDGSIEAGRHWLMHKLNLHIDYYRIGSVIGIWENQRPEVKLQYGLGFYTAIWNDLFQLATSRFGVYQCACGRFFVKPGRRSKYCDTCRTGSKGSKRQYISKCRSQEKGLVNP